MCSQENCLTKEKNIDKMEIFCVWIEKSSYSYREITGKLKGTTTHFTTVNFKEYFLCNKCNSGETVM